MNKNNPAEQLREIRKSKGWSLQDVERYSNGKWKAVVIGSYERSDRAISLKKAILLMEFYKVPISELFPEAPIQITQQAITLNLHNLSKNESVSGEKIRSFSRYICNRRKDWNGQLLSIRESDLQFLSLLLDQNQTELIDFLSESELLAVK